jgi:hypothetical protein
VQIPYASQLQLFWALIMIISLAPTHPPKRDRAEHTSYAAHAALTWRHRQFLRTLSQRARPPFPSCGEIRERRKTPSGKLRDEFGHTPLSIEEKIPWKCDRLVIGLDPVFQAYRKSSTSLDESINDGALIKVVKYTTSGLPTTRPRSRLPDDVILTLTLSFAQGSGMICCCYSNQ